MNKITPCAECALRKMPLFCKIEDAELVFIQSMKVDEVNVKAGRDVFIHDASTSLYTIYSGWAYRYRSLGPRNIQIAEILLPGDLIGLQAVVARGEKVRALTDTTLCVLRGRRLDEMVAAVPRLFLDVFTLLVMKLREADERLVSLGKRDALQRLAFFLLDIFGRLDGRGMAEADACPLPLQRRHFAAKLGLSGTHVRRSLDELAARGLARVDDGTLHILDRERLTELAVYPGGQAIAGRMALL